MAKNKKGFILYADLIHTLDKLPDEKAGKLFKHILDYVNDEDPETDDLIISIAFEPIKQQLKRDLKKYESICERNKINGSKGGRPKNPNKTKKPIGLIGNPTEPKKPDKDIDTDKDNDKEKDINIDFDTFWDLYDKKNGLKSKVEAKWNKLTDKDRQDIIDYIPKYKEAQPEKRFRKHPATFLNNESWKDELISSVKPKKKKLYFQGSTVRVKADGSKWVIRDGEWIEFCGEEKDLVVKYE